MVATVLRIRFAILGNVLASSPWQIVAFAMGAIGALWLVVAAAVGLFFAGAAGADAAHAAVTAVGAVVTLGWVLGPVIAAGVDTTMDAGRLAAFPLTTRQVMVSLVAVGLAGVPGIATALGGAATLAVWWRWPAALAAAVLCVPVGVLTCVVASRMVATFAAGGGRGRRVADAVGLLLFGGLILAGPIIAGVADFAGAGSGPESGDRLGAAIGVVSWTPVGAAWSVPGDLAAGSPLTAAAKAAIAVATLVVLWFVWRRGVAAASLTPVVRGRGRRRAGRLGWFGRLPTTALGATWARSLTYWLQDPRYLRQLVVVPLLPVLIAFPTRWDLTSDLFLFSPVFVALILGFVPFADVSYDGTAFAGIVAAGVRGRADRAGRLLAAGSVAVPLVAAVALAVIALSGRWDLLPAIAGAAVGVLLVAYGVAAVTSALFIVAVPASGDNVFKRVPGTTFWTGLAVFGVFLATAVLAAPAIVPAVFAIVGGVATAGWIAVAVGVGYGLMVAAAGVLAGGRIFDATAPSLLARLQTLKGI